MRTRLVTRNWKMHVNLAANLAENRAEYRALPGRFKQAVAGGLRAKDIPK